MRIYQLSIPGVYLLEPARHVDERGFFSETFRQDTMDSIAPGIRFVQDNHSFSSEAGTLRGLHFQTTPHAQGKLVRVPRGSALDVVVDIRNGSPTFGRHVAVELSEANWHQLWVPAGMAHGFCTLEPNTEFCYKVTDHYAPSCDFGIAFDDPDLGISWPFEPDRLRLSDKDKSHPRLRCYASPFEFHSDTPDGA